MLRRSPRFSRISKAPRKLGPIAMAACARSRPLKDDALCLGSARGLQEALGIADMMVAVFNESRRAFKNGFQPFLSFKKGQPVHLLAVEK
jgi:hypothetical protein